MLQYADLTKTDEFESRDARPVTRTADHGPRLTYQVLRETVNSLPKELAMLANTILQASQSMDPSHLDMLGREGGLRIWNVSSDGTKQLYYEVYELLTQHGPFYAMTSAQIQEMVDLLLDSKGATGHLAAKITLAQAIEKDRAERDEANATTRSGIQGFTQNNLSRHAVQGAQELSNFLAHRTSHINTSAYELYGGLTVGEHSTMSPHSRQNQASILINDDTESDMSSEDEDASDEQDGDDGGEARASETAKKPTTRSKGGSKPKVKAKKTKGNRGPGKKYYRWPEARLRVFREMLGRSDDELPETALEGALDELQSFCTPGSTDIRLCDFDVSVEEILTVSA
jgi:hypothetical protein